MDEPIESGEGQTGPEPVGVASETAPWIIRYGIKKHGLRHVKRNAIIRLVVALWLVILGCIFWAFGQWWGALLLVPAVLNVWLSYQVPRWKRALDVLKNGPRVRELEHSRALVVDDAATRLRRIEQDLHDGAQAQMVAVVMKLGLAREQLEGLVKGAGRGDPERALQLIDAAHQGAMDAIAELRDLARGILPPALHEGLAAALTALAARSDIPVELRVDLPERPSAAIETIAYFCAAELITNVAKHSWARHATIEVMSKPGLIRLSVADDGTGGASIQAGGGLAGLIERVGTVDGRLQLTSPVGGPTMVTVELPSHT